MKRGRLPVIISLVGAPGKVFGLDRRSGGMLLLALLLISLTGLLTVSAALFSRGALRRVSNHRARQTARRAAWDALTLTAVQLAGQTNGWNAFDQPWANPPVPPRPGRQTPHGWIEGPEYAKPADRVSGLRDAESRINLNTADAVLLTRLLTLGSGLDADAAEALTLAIMDWRSPVEPDAAAANSDAARALLTARRRPYLDADVPWTPPGAPLSCLEELRLLPGGQALDLERLAAYATVWGAGPVNLNTASDDVLRLVFEAAADGIDRGAAERLLARVGEARRSGFVARALTPEALSGWFGAGVSARLSPPEIVLVGRLINAGWVDVRSRVFEGVAVGVAPALPSPLRVRIAFAWDRATGRTLYWREDGL